MSRESRSIDLNERLGAGSDLDKLLLASPEVLWRAWIEKIVADPEMNLDRTMRHVQAHIGQHMPDADADKDRWEEWLAGSYNLLAILSTELGINPPFTMGNELLLRKWLKAPSDHTPPPEAVPPARVPRARRYDPPAPTSDGS